MIKKGILKILAWSGLTVLCAVVALAQDQAPAAGQRSDGQIEMDVVHALDASHALKNDLITAATIQSEVTLSGTVSSESSKELAESIVSRINGVTGVHNNLNVGNPQDAQNQSHPAGADNDAQPADQSQQDAGPAPPPQAYPQQAAPNQDQGQYPAYPPPPARQRPQYTQPPQYAAQPAYEAPTGPVTVPEGTLLQLRTNEPIGSRRAQNGEPVQFTVIADVAFGGVLAIPRGATVHGIITETKHSGELAGSAELALTVTSLDLGAQSYPLQTDEFRVKGPNKAGRTASNAVGGAILGAIIGGAVGRGPGAAIGAAAGAGAGTAASAASSGPGVWIPAEARVDFHLRAPLTVQPVSQQEAMRLAQGLFQGGPSLYRRAGYPYARPYPYGYPPVYYRPYYMVGGFYYWR